MQNRQGKRGRFAGACLGSPHDVLASHRKRDCLRLNRGGYGVAGINHGLQQRWMQPDFRKRGDRGGGRIDWLSSRGQVV